MPQIGLRYAASLCRGARQQDNLAVGLGALDDMRPWAAELEFDADGRFAVEEDAAHERLGDDL
jgi:hypothetical protein